MNKLDLSVRVKDEDLGVSLLPHAIRDAEKLMQEILVAWHYGNVLSSALADALKVVRRVLVWKRLEGEGHEERI